ncbi:MAG: Mg2+ and Co2+ transporter CorB [Clostridiales bacterium]|nr:Mg2+ and Co2+ transporter CorB [Clostridiales bacterium]
MKNTDSVPRQETEEVQQNKNNQDVLNTNQDEQNVEVKKKTKERASKKKKKRNLWPLKALLITLVLSAAVNAASTLVLDDSTWWLATILTVVIMLLGVVFDIIGTASTACDIQPFLAMASRKVKGAKLAVKLSQKSDVVSSVCCDIVGDVCGIVSGISAATLVFFATSPVENLKISFLISVLVYAVISTLTITLKAIGKGIAVNKSNKIIFGVAKTLSIFRKEG